jgi:hypothetical protein
LGAKFCEQALVFALQLLYEPSVAERIAARRCRRDRQSEKPSDENAGGQFFGWHGPILAHRIDSIPACLSVWKKAPRALLHLDLRMSRYALASVSSAKTGANALRLILSNPNS